MTGRMEVSVVLVDTVLKVKSPVEPGAIIKCEVPWVPRLAPGSAGVLAGKKGEQGPPVGWDRHASEGGPCPLYRADIV